MELDLIICHLLYRDRSNHLRDLKVFLWFSNGTRKILVCGVFRSFLATQAR